jgi:hypothetical protein
MLAIVIWATARKDLTPDPHKKYIPFTWQPES